MKILLLYPPTPETFWSFKHVLRFVKSLWLLGVWHQGRLAYWRLFVTELLRRPRQFPKAMQLAIMGEWRLRKCSTCGTLARRMKHDRSLIPAHEGTV